MSAFPLAAAADEARVARAWEVLGTVLDPEVPALSVCDLGIVREVLPQGEGLEIVLTPTYSGCPATEVIERGVHSEHMGYILAEMQFLQRAYPGGVW
jgi:ring-1,2-phenylacetyl-CoA epoxidase subunit PaaD